MYGKLLLICLSLSFFKPSSILAQENITSSGGDASGSGGSVAFSVGQIVYSAQTNVNGTVHQGVEIAYVTDDVIGEISQPGCLCVYPNPTEGNLILEVPAFVDQNYSFRLYSMLGVLLISDHVKGIKTYIHTDVLPGAAYLLQIFQNDEKLKTVKVLKK